MTNYPAENVTNRLETEPAKQDAFRNQMQEQLQRRIRGDFELPSVETMRYEVETGDVSPESAAKAQAILRAADDPEMLAYISELQANAVAGSQRALQNPDEWLDDVDKKPTRFVPKPSQIKSASRAMQKLGADIKVLDESVQKTATAFREIGRVKKEYVPQPHLTHRPFKTRELENLRHQLRSNQR